MNSTFNLTCVGDGSVLYIYMYVCMYVCMYVFICVCARACVCVGGKTSILISEYHNCFDYDHHCKRCQRNTSLCYLLEQFIWQQKNPLVPISYCGKCFISPLLYDCEVSVSPTSGLTGLSECTCHSNVSNITLELSDNLTDTCSNSVAGTWRLGNIQAKCWCRFIQRKTAKWLFQHHGWCKSIHDTSVTQVTLTSLQVLRFVIYSKE